jgi:MoxR-like ATPase
MQSTPLQKTDVRRTGSVGGARSLEVDATEDAAIDRLTERNPAEPSVRMPADQARRERDRAREARAYELLRSLAMDERADRGFSIENRRAVASYYRNFCSASSAILKRMPEQSSVIGACAPQMPLPNHLRSIIPGALGLDCVQPEHPSALGHLDEKHDAAGYRRILGEESKRMLTVSDGQIEAVIFGPGGWPRELSKMLEGLSPTSTWMAIRIYARALELDLPGIVVTPADLDRLAHALPDTHFAAASLLRLALQARVPLENVHLGRRLATRYPAPTLSSHWWQQPAHGQTRTGFTSFTQLEGALISGRYQPEWASDAEIRELFGVILEAEEQRYFDRMAKPQLAELYTRGLENGLRHPPEASRWFSISSVSEGVTGAICDARVARALDRSGSLFPPASRIPTKWLELSERFADNPDPNAMLRLHFPPSGLALASRDRNHHLMLLDQWIENSDSLLGSELRTHIRMMPPELRYDAKIMDRLAKLVNALGERLWYPASEVLIEGKALTHHAPYARAAERLKGLPVGELVPIRHRRPFGFDLPETKLGDEKFSGMAAVVAAFENGDERPYKMDDDSIRSLQWAPDVKIWEDKLYAAAKKDHRVFGIFARAAELGDQQLKEKVRAWFEDRSMFRIYSDYVSPVSIPYLLRIAQATDIPINDLMVQGGLTNNMRYLCDEPGFPDESWRSWDERHRNAWRAELSKLDPALDVSAHSRLDAAKRVISGESGMAELTELLPAVIAQIVEGTLSPAEIPPGRDRVALGRELLDPWSSLPAGALLAALLVKLPREDLAEALESKGAPAADASRWARLATGLASLDARRLPYAADTLLTQPGSPDYLDLEVRLELATRPITEEALAELYEKLGRRSPTRWAEAVMDRALATPPGNKVRSIAVGHIENLIATDQLDYAELRSTLSEEALAPFKASAEAPLLTSLQAFRAASDQELDTAADELVGCIRKGTLSAGPAELTRAVLASMLQADLESVIPLDKAERMRRRSPAALRMTENKRELSTEGFVDVLGRLLPMHDDPDRDWDAVPSEEETRLTYCHTAVDNLKRFADAWQIALPGWGEGKSSTGKTSLIAHICAKTKTPYRRVVGSPDMKERELMGRRVDGAKIWSREMLEKLTPGQIRRVGYDYGFNARGMDIGAAIQRILDTQEKPHFCYGPLPRAAMEGECLVIDEARNIDPGVLNLLHNLVDADRRTLTVDENDAAGCEVGPEVIRPDKNFRLYFTTNGLDLEARNQISKATGSRIPFILVKSYDMEDLLQIVDENFGDLPEDVRNMMVQSHLALSELADNDKLAQETGGVIFTVRDLKRVGERYRTFAALQKQPLDEPARRALLRREIEEIYRGGLWQENDLKEVDAVLTTAVPYDGPSFYDHLQLEVNDKEVRMGDVTVSVLNIDHRLVPGPESELIMTARTKEYMYRYLKTIMMRENAAFIGEAGAGKTSIPTFAAHLRKQPFDAQLMTKNKTNRQIIGGYTRNGFHRGPVLYMSDLRGLLLIDEWSALAAGPAERLNSVFDHERALTVTEGDGRRVKMHEDSVRTVAYNPATEEYAGAQAHTVASDNRFVRIYVRSADPAEEAEILRNLNEKRRLPENVADVALDLLAWVRGAYGIGTQNGAKDEGAPRLGESLETPPNIGFREAKRVIQATADYVSKGRTVRDSFLAAVGMSFLSSQATSDNDQVLKQAELVAEELEG